MKKNIFVLVILCVISLIFILDTDRYISQNISKIDQADIISIINDKMIY